MAVSGTTAGADRYRLEHLPARIAAKIKVEPCTGCWEWQGWRSHDGYGYVWWEGRDRSAHRAVYQLLVGPIPDGFTLDHVRERGCRSKACCWPAHLEPVTTTANTRRFWGGPYDPDTYCWRGHERTPENTYTRPNGKTVCRPCSAEASARFRRKAS